MGWQQSLEPYIGCKVRANYGREARTPYCQGTLLAVDDDCMTIRLGTEIKVCLVGFRNIYDVDILEIPPSGQAAQSDNARAIDIQQ